MQDSGVADAPGLHSLPPERGWSRTRRGWYAAMGGVVTMAVVGLIAHLSHQTFLFPSLGPTVFLIYFAAESRQAAPRNVVCGQLIGLAAGLAAVLVVGLRDVPVDLTDITLRRLAAVLLALAATFVLMPALGVEHAPAAATTMIVALGIVHTPVDILAVIAAILCTVVIGFAINRAFRIDYPVWAPRDASVSSL